MLIRSVNSIEILTVMDNYADILLDDNSWIHRMPVLTTGNEISRETLQAEHGLSLLVRATDDNRMSCFLLDAGNSRTGVPHNLELLGIDIGIIDALVLSHGHLDHFGGLSTLLKKMKRKLPVIMHPGALEGPRYVERADKTRLKQPQLSKMELEEAGAELILSAEPFAYGDRLWTTTGTIERTTDFELGMPHMFIEKNGELEHDPIIDDQAIVLHIKKKGLVIITGCGHSGIINTIRHAVKITGIHDIHAIIGGFHLSGKRFEHVIEPTVNALKDFNPRIIVPAHCTGPLATNRIREVFGAGFGLNSVGTTFYL